MTQQAGNSMKFLSFLLRYTVRWSPGSLMKFWMIATYYPPWNQQLALKNKAIWKGNESSSNPLLLRGELIVLGRVNIIHIWLVVSTHLINISQNGNLPQVVKQPPSRLQPGSGCKKKQVNLQALSPSFRYLFWTTTDSTTISKKNIF